MTTRRAFLFGAASAALAAPAIVRASSLMKLWVPPAPPAPKLLAHTWLYDNTGRIVGLYEDQPDGMTKFSIWKSEYDRTNGTVSNATMFKVILSQDVTPYWPRPFA